MKRTARIGLYPSTAKRLEEYRKTFPGDVSASYAANVALDLFFEGNLSALQKPEWKHSPTNQDK